MLDNYREHIFDGIVIDAGGGDLRFVDAPEVARTAERAVTLTITSAEAAELPPPESGPSMFRPRGGGKLSRLFGGGWRKSCRQAGGALIRSRQRSGPVRDAGASSP